MSGLFARIHLGYEMCVHVWEDLEMNQTWTQNQQSKVTGQRKPGRNVPWKWFNCHDSVTLPLSWLWSLSTSTIPLFLQINNLFVSPLSVSTWKFVSTQLMGQGLTAGLWLRGLVAEIQHSSCVVRPPSLARNWSPALSSCRPRSPRINSTISLVTRTLPASRRCSSSVCGYVSEWMHLSTLFLIHTQSLPTPHCLTTYKYLLKMR